VADDRSTNEAQSEAPAAAGSSAAPRDPGSGEAPGLRAQATATFAAARRLVQAHVDLARAELADILDEVKRLLGLIGAAIGIAILASLLLLIGSLLFLGEWLFGSIGWGVLLGTLLLIDVAAMLVLAALDVPGRRLGTAVGLADSVAAQYDPNTRAVLLAAGASAAVLAILGFLAGLRGGFRGALGSLVGWAVVGGLLGLLTVASLPATVGAALGALAWLVTWPLLAARAVMREGIDGEAMKRKFTPEATIELTKETIEWVRERTPLVPKS
jgi:hypothetical protein